MNIESKILLIFTDRCCKGLSFYAISHLINCIDTMCSIASIFSLQVAERLYSTEPAIKGSPEKHEFQAETRMLLDIVAKSLYSEKEVIKFHIFQSVLTYDFVL